MQRKRSQHDFSAEVQAHLQIEIDRLMADGATEEQARSAALQAFGNVTSVQERFYESQRLLWLDHFLRDLRYAARMLRKNPGLTTVVVATMALGIGASSAIFTVVNAVLLRPLPYPEPDRLVMCIQNHAQYGPEVVTLTDYLDWRDHSTQFEHLGGAWNLFYNLTGVEQPERIASAAVTANLFQAVALPPLLGRTIASEEERDVVVLGHALWKRQFGGQSDVLGRSITLNGKAHKIIGVMPAAFTFPTPAELWVPLVPEPGMNRGYHQLWVVGRLKRGATVEQARTELASIAAQAEREHPDTNKNLGVHVAKLQDFLVGSSRRSLLILAGAVGCLLLLACANIAGLLMSRSVARRHEMSVRAALGASRIRIVRQLLTESVLLSICGGAAGLALAAWAKEPLLALTTLPRADEISLDGRVVIFTLLASAATGILFGMAPALAALRSTLRGELAVRGSSVRLRPVLVSFQIAVAVVLLAGAGLLMRSVHRLQQVETGFSAERVLTFRFFLPRATYPVEQCVRLYQRMTERIEALPGVESAAAVSLFPFSGSSANVVFQIPGRPAPPPGEHLTAEFRAATPGYFRTMGIPIHAGRDIELDSAESPFVAVVNQAMADRFFDGRNPIGEYVQILGPKPRRIVGVVQNIRHRGMDSKFEPEIYVPHTQYPLGGMFLAVRTRFEDPLAAASAVRAELKKLDPGLPIARVETWTQMLDRTLSARRFSLILLSIFAGVALILSIIGVYGMLSFHISQRTREIGIRMAIGATPFDVVRGAVSAGMIPVAVGLSAGLAGAVAATRVLKSQLFEIRPTDPSTLVVVMLVLLGSAFTASLIPARRASRIDPMAAVRHE